MAQFDVHSNRSPETRDRIPYLLDVQSDLLDPLATRVVVPLASRDSVRAPPAERLMPGFDIEGHSVVMLTPQIVGVPRGFREQIADPETALPALLKRPG